MQKDPICGMSVSEKSAIKLEKDGKTYYFCSEHCRQAFLTHRKTGGHAAHHGHMVEDFKKRFWISAIATIPVLILSPFIQSLLGYSLKFPGDKFALFFISALIYFYGGWPFLKGLFDELKEKMPGMMTLIGMAVSVAFIYSSLVVFGVKGEVFFWELVTLIDIMLLGHWIEMRSVMGASKALEDLAKLMPSEAHLVLKDLSIKDIKIENLKKGDIILIKPGEKIPADSLIIEGESEINQAMITGESSPVTKKKGDKLIGGSINGSGSLRAEVKKTGEDSYIAQVVELVRTASESKSKAQDFADKAAFWLTLIAITAGTVTLIAWLLLGKEFVFALERMVTVMVITCPHALGLAIPLVVVVVTAISAKNGLLIRNRTSFENARNLNIIVFDKTGTLTKGEFGVTDIVSLGDWEENELLRKAASVEINSEHTIAKGIISKAKERNIKIPESERFEAIPGRGAKAIIEGKQIYIGNKGILEFANIGIGETGKADNMLESEGKTLVYIASEGKLRGIIGLADIIREESKAAVDKLKSLGLEVAMITGDNYATAKYVADNLGLDLFFAEVLPDKKSEKIRELQRGGKKVAMVGDGVNDAPALAAADLGVAIGGGTDVAIETADVILVENDPRDVVNVIGLSRMMQKKMAQNLAWATGYNLIAIPLAAGVLYNYNILMPPAIGAVVMSLSTIVVAINARLIYYKKY